MSPGLAVWKLDKKSYKDEKIITETLADCLFDGEVASFLDVLYNHNHVNSKSKMAAKKFHKLMPEEPQDLRISTIAPILNSLKAG